MLGDLSTFLKLPNPDIFPQVTYTCVSRGMRMHTGRFAIRRLLICLSAT